MKQLMKGMVTASWVLLSGIGVHVLDVGVPAPDFTGDSNLGPVHLAALRGQNVLLAFFLADFTPV